MEYRVEQKYLINDAQIEYLKRRLAGCVSEDKHAVNGTYLVRSVYFDDMYDTCLNDNISGVDNREKFRIRTYNNDTSVIRLELKIKKKGYTKKRQTRIGGEELSYLLSKDIYALRDKCNWCALIPGESLTEHGEIYTEEDVFLRKKLYAAMLNRRMQPVNMIEYERTAYVGDIGNVRITFDRCIGGTYEYDSFTDKVAAVSPLLPTGQHILEVKYDEVLPDVIRQSIDAGAFTRTAFSKYSFHRINYSQNMARY